MVKKINSYLFNPKDEILEEIASRMKWLKRSKASSS